MFELIAGTLEIILACFVFHRVLPALRGESLCTAFRSWAFGLAVLLLGVTLALEGVGYQPPPSLNVLAHTSLIACAAMQGWRVKGAEIKTWAQAGKDRRAKMETLNG